MATGLNTPHTPSPAPLDADPFSWLRLIRSYKVGAVTFHRLLREHGSVQAGLAALPEIARAAGIENYSPCPINAVRDEVMRGRKAGARLLLWGEEGYPASLMDMADAPPVLWALGDVGLLARPMVALVGARNASSLGLRMARRMAAGLSEAGQVVVSGLARGIDAEAHQAALAGGTVAVQAGGVDVIYPMENSALAVELAAKGCRISEQPMGMQPQARHFPMRNRIISGLARAVVVVEAAAKSGSLITARTALDQGREVLAVPGHPLDARAAGCNMLLRDGATLVRGPEDVIEVLGGMGGAAGAAPLVARRVEEARVQERRVEVAKPEPARRSLADMAAVHAQILARLGPSPLAEDQLIRDMAMGAAALAPAIMSLELDGLIERQPGGFLCRLS